VFGASQVMPFELQAARPAAPTRSRADQRFMAYSGERKRSARPEVLALKAGARARRVRPRWGAARRGLEGRGGWRGSVGGQVISCSKVAREAAARPMVVARQRFSTTETLRSLATPAVQGEGRGLGGRERGVLGRADGRRRDGRPTSLGRARWGARQWGRSGDEEPWLQRSPLRRGAWASRLLPEPAAGQVSWLPGPREATRASAVRSSWVFPALCSREWPFLRGAAGGYPATVAGPRRTRTGFPFTPLRAPDGNVAVYWGEPGVSSVARLATARVAHRSQGAILSATRGGG